ncbi:hypothetical protein Poly51_39830 [Rubripirellula tenax]|uniref:Uncharacterized protein n=1 Tax=Rubripirellula tenax TaxID=2528015 RepID=A0A5C6EQX1_9BACT|nr:hypothetical protein [Rubripirellula tenax]TWU50690.1 hypothetical protein Poly51_39830 [Rubripirellula tenax]
MAIKIDIWYRLRDADSDGHLSLTPESYFDPVDTHETYEQDGIPRFNFTWQYLDVPRDRLLWSIERRAGTEDDATFSTQYFDGGRTTVNHRSDPNGYEELIHAFDFGGTYFTVRSFKQPDGRWVAHMATHANRETDAELYAFPADTFSLAESLSLKLAAIAAQD